MKTGRIDLEELLARMASRDESRTEANVQSDLHALLLAAPLNLAEHDLQDLEIVLEQQAGARRRIDVEVGLCVFEVKRDLRKPNLRADAEKQLLGYVVQRTTAMQRRYVGVLTDGAEWHLYHLASGALVAVSSFMVDPARPDVDRMTVWIEGVLATGQKLTPTPREIQRRLGAGTPGHALDRSELWSLYERHKSAPTIKLKRDLWARLLTTAFGTGFDDSDTLFVEHTLLVVSAEIIAHAVLGMLPIDESVSAIAIVSGQLFESAQVRGVVEADFFDWIVEVPGGDSFVKGMARRMSRFAWDDVEHDVLKILYESVISAEQRKKLGEYYTPDWLAERIVETSVSAPLTQRVLDPSCGSGTFLFHAVRRYLDAAAAKGWGNEKSLAGVTRNVLGMDIHPVAVTFARVTYLLAIGSERLQAMDRPSLSIPVFLGDSIQWGQERPLFQHNALSIPTSEATLLQEELRFPASTLTDAARFDEMVSALSNLAAELKPGTGSKEATTLVRRYGVAAPDDVKVLMATFNTLQHFHAEGRDHIWGYYVRNLARPFWLTRAENRIDVLVGNPPWLSFRFMTTEMQQEFRRLSEIRGLWAGAAVATNQDLSALFILRAAERYLRVGGRFAFVMPWSALRGRQWAGLRAGRHPIDEDETFAIAYTPAWDLHAVKPPFFPVPSCVLFGTRTDGAPSALPSSVVAWRGKLPSPNMRWTDASKHIEHTDATVLEGSDGEGERSPYAPLFAQGATVVPKVFFVVEEKVAKKGIGLGAGRVGVESRRSANEKAPWKGIPSLISTIERQFVHALHSGPTILPYRTLSPHYAVIPWDMRRKCLMDGDDPEFLQYPAARDWFRAAEKLWNKLRSNDGLSLRAQLDYRRKLTAQFPKLAPRVVYNASGMYLAAAVVDEPSLFEHTLYWATPTTAQEGHYLAAVLNSDVLTRRLRPMQARGEHNPRHYDKYVWNMPIPRFDSAVALHAELAALGLAAKELAEAVVLPERARFESKRAAIRRSIGESEVGRNIERAVTELLP